MADCRRWKRLALSKNQDAVPWIEKIHIELGKRGMQDTFVGDIVTPVILHHLSQPAPSSKSICAADVQPINNAFASLNMFYTLLPPHSIPCSACMSADSKHRPLVMLEQQWSSIWAWITFFLNSYPNIQISNDLLTRIPPHSDAYGKSLTILASSINDHHFKKCCTVETGALHFIVDLWSRERTYPDEDCILTHWAMRSLLVADSSGTPTTTMKLVRSRFHHKQDALARWLLGNINILNNIIAVEGDILRSCLASELYILSISAQQDPHFLSAILKQNSVGILCDVLHKQSMRLPTSEDGCAKSYPTTFLMLILEHLQFIFNQRGRPYIFEALSHKLLQSLIHCSTSVEHISRSCCYNECSRDEIQKIKNTSTAILALVRTYTCYYSVLRQVRKQLHRISLVRRYKSWLEEFKTTEFSGAWTLFCHFIEEEMSLKTAHEPRVCTHEMVSRFLSPNELIRKLMHLFEV
jgi:hypothetical protein